MSREIKFRVYIPDHEKFSYFSLGDFDYSDRYLHQHKYPVQQFTGLKDKNGVDIYEGDIIKISKLYYEVMWVEYKWIAYCPNYRRYNWPTLEHFNEVDSIEVRCGEVAGNVFENKDLLK